MFPYISIAFQLFLLFLQHLNLDVGNGNQPVMHVLVPTPGQPRKKRKKEIKYIKNGTKCHKNRISFGCNKIHMHMFCFLVASRRKLRVQDGIVQGNSFPFIPLAFF